MQDSFYLAHCTEQGKPSPMDQWKRCFGFLAQASSSSIYKVTVIKQLLNMSAAQSFRSVILQILSALAQQAVCSKSALFLPAFLQLLLL